LSLSGRARPGYEAAMNVVAVYPLKPASSRTINVALIGVATLAGIALVGRQLVGGEPELRWLHIGLIVLFAAFPAAYWFTTRGPRIGGGDVELSRDRVRIPTMNGDPIELALDGIALELTASSVGLAYGPIPVGPGLETGRRLRLSSRGQSVVLDRDAFQDEDHFRQLIEHIGVVTAGGTPDGSAAYMATGLA
jgi:hypothetical protein